MKRYVWFLGSATGFKWESYTPLPLMSSSCSLECIKDSAEQSYWTEKTKSHLENDGVEIKIGSGLVITTEH